MPSDTVRAAYQSARSARVAPRGEFVNNQQYAKTKHVTFMVPGYSNFTVELSKATKDRIKAAGGVEGDRDQKGIVIFKKDYNGDGIPWFRILLQKSRTPPPPRKPSYPMPLIANYLGSQYQYQSDRCIGVYKATFEVKVRDDWYTFTKLVTGMRLDDLKWNRKVPGELDADGYGTFTLPGYPAETFKRELWPHDY